MRVHRHGFVVLVVCLALLAALLAGSPTPAGAAVPPGFELAWGSSGSGDGQFNLPVGVASSGFSGGSVYVLDHGNARVERFDVNGAFVGQFGSFGSGISQFNQPRGIAVGPDGSVYVADTGNNRVMKFDAAGGFQTVWGVAGSGNGQFLSPTGVAVDSVGNVFVADTGNNRIQKFTAAGTFKTKWGASGTVNGRFRSPFGIAVSADRKVYVADTDNNRVQRFTGTGVFERQWGGLGSGDGEFDSPQALTVDTSGNVYVADSHNNRVQQFSAAGAFLSKWGSGGSTNGLFGSPLGIGVAPDGVKVLVADTFNHRIQRFAPAGAAPGAPPTFVNTWGTEGTGQGEFFQPFGVAVDPMTGNVYVADAGNHRIQKFSSTGSYLTQSSPACPGLSCAVPVSVAVGPLGVVYITDATTHRLQKFSAAGDLLGQWGGPFSSNPTQFFQPQGVAVDRSGNVYVADTGNHRIQTFTSAGVFVTQWGASGSGNGQFIDPVGIAVDATGTVYVADTGNNRIQKFSSTGTYLGQWGSGGPGPGQFAEPRGVAIDAVGNVYVADAGNSRIQKFTSAGSYLTEWSEWGTDIAVAPSGDVYVLEGTNSRVQRLAPGSPSAPVVSLSADQGSVGPGDPIDYHVTVTNTTAATLTGVRLTDARAPDCEGSLANIAPAASVVVDCTYNTGPDDAGSYVNTATLDSDQTNAINSNAVTTQVGPALTVTLTAPTKVTATGTIAYAIGITNNTALPLTGVRVKDPVVPGCAGPIADIAPGATANVNCSKSTSDADAGSTVFNAVTVDASGAQDGLATAVTRVQGRVTGTVSGPGGPVAGAYVLALSRDFLPLAGDAVANGSGVFNLGLDPGRYYLAFLDPSGATQAEYFNNKTDVAQLSTADLVTVNVGSGPATVNATLAAGFLPVVNPATVSGTVTDANGPVAGVWVVAINGGVRSATRTDASGQYTVGNLPAGNAFLEFPDPSGAHAFRWYLNNNGSSPTAIPLTAGQHLTGINQTLPAYP